MTKTEIPIPDQMTAIKLASLAVHADEMTSPTGAPVDATAIRSIVEDDDVKAFLNAMPDALLPVKRGGA